MNQNNNNSYSGNNNYSKKANIKITDIHFNDKDEIVGIVDGKQKDYVDIAEEVILTIKQDINNNNRKEKLTTSKIRNIMSMASEIYKTVVSSSSDELSPNVIADMQYLRVRYAYESGRTDSVKHLIDNSRLKELIKEVSNKKNRLKNYYHYIEALISWFKYHGGKEN